jgi:hypothetical protein
MRMGGEEKGGVALRAEVVFEMGRVFFFFGVSSGVLPAQHTQKGHILENSLYITFRVP